MRWVLLLLFGYVYSNINMTCPEENWLTCTNLTNITCLNGTNVTCVPVTCNNGYCTNNTCSYGYYNTSYDECKHCIHLRKQYHDEDCCTGYSISMPSRSMEIYHSIYPNDTGTEQVYFTPPREICNHLWYEWGTCPRICNGVVIGDVCNIDIDCLNGTSCRGFCCVLLYGDNCTSCANNTGYCENCVNGMAFNATGDLSCDYCLTGRFSENNTCFYHTNCIAGFYPINIPNSTTDRNCSVVPHGYFTNGTNQNITSWSNCSNSTWYSFLGSTSRDRECSNFTTCANYSYIFQEGTNISDKICQNHTSCNVTVTPGNNTHDAVCG